MLSSKIMFYFLHRNDQNTEAMSKAHAIEDLHSRLKSNVESIQQLNQQVSSHTVLNHNGYSPCKNLYSSDSLIRSTQTLPRRKKYSNTFSTSVWKVGKGGERGTANMRTKQFSTHKGTLWMRISLSLICHNRVSFSLISKSLIGHFFP